MRSQLAIAACIAFVFALAGPKTAIHAEDSLFQLREEVRTEDPPSPSRNQDGNRRATSYNPSSDPNNPDTSSDGWGEFLMPAIGVAGRWHLRHRKHQVVPVGLGPMQKAEWGETVGFALALDAGHCIEKLANLGNRGHFVP